MTIGVENGILNDYIVAMASKVSVTSAVLPYPRTYLGILHQNIHKRKECNRLSYKSSLVVVSGTYNL